MTLVWTEAHNFTEKHTVLRALLSKFNVWFERIKFLKFRKKAKKPRLKYTGPEVTMMTANPYK